MSIIVCQSLCVNDCLSMRVCQHCQTIIVCQSLSVDGCLKADFVVY